MSSNLAKGYVQMSIATPVGEVYFTNIKELTDKKKLKKVYESEGVVKKDKNGIEFWSIDNSDGGKDKLRVVVLFHKDDEGFIAFKKEIDTAMTEAKKKYADEDLKVSIQKPYKVFTAVNPEDPDDKDIRIKTNYYEMSFDSQFVPAVYDKDGVRVNFLDKSCPLFGGSYDKDLGFSIGGSKVKLGVTLVDSIPAENSGKLFLQRRLDDIQVLEKPVWFSDDYQPKEKTSTRKSALFPSV